MELHQSLIICKNQTTLHIHAHRFRRYFVFVQEVQTSTTLHVDSSVGSFFDRLGGFDLVLREMQVAPLAPSVNHTTRTEFPPVLLPRRKSLFNNTTSIRGRRSIMIMIGAFAIFGRRMTTYIASSRLTSNRTYHWQQRTHRNSSRLSLSWHSRCPRSSHS